MNLFSKTGVGAPGASALRKQTKRMQKSAETQQQQQMEQLKQLSLIEFKDNIENYKRKHCRSRKNKRYAPYKSRVIRIPVYVPPSNPHHRAQFTAPLRHSPLPPLTMAAFEPTNEGKQAYDAFRQQNMLTALAHALASPSDPVRRQISLTTSLHIHGLSAKTCANPRCSARFTKLFQRTKRKCPVMPVVSAIGWFILWLLCVQRCKQKVQPLHSLGLDEGQLVAPAQPPAAGEAPADSKQPTPSADLLSRAVVTGDFYFVASVWCRYATDRGMFEPQMERASWPATRPSSKPARTIPGR